MRLKPINKDVFIEFTEKFHRKVTTGGIILSPVFLEKTRYAKVLATGKNVTRVSPGQYVFVDRYKGKDIEYEKGEPLRRVMHENDVLGIVEENEDNY